MEAQPLQTVVAKLADIVGADNIVTSPEKMQRYTQDVRNTHSGSCCLVVRPANTAEVAEIVKKAAQLDLKLVPQGGNTGLVGGQIPLCARHVVVSLERMNSIRSVNPAANAIIADAGVSHRPDRERRLISTGAGQAMIETYPTHDPAIG